MFNSSIFCLLMLGERITLYFSINGATIVSENRAHVFNVSIFYYPIDIIPYIKLKSHSMMSRKYVTDI